MRQRGAIMMTAPPPIVASRLPARQLTLSIDYGAPAKGNDVILFQRALLSQHKSMAPALRASPLHAAMILPAARRADAIFRHGGR